eukprot:5831401-Alexandrium_andersonii.AAC.1
MQQQRAPPRRPRLRTGVPSCERWFNVGTGNKIPGALVGSHLSPHMPRNHEPPTLMYRPCHAFASCYILLAK